MATALGYDRQNVDSTVGRVGWQARFDGGTVKPYVQVTYDHEFEDTKQASAWLQTLPELGSYRVPGLDFDKNYATAVLGARMDLFGLQGNVGLSTTAAQKRARDATIDRRLGKPWRRHQEARRNPPHGRSQQGIRPLPLVSLTAL